MDMTELSLQQLENTAAAYDRLLAPAVLQPWTHLVADAADIGSGQRVLDVACGTGVLTRTALARAGADGSITGLDINPGMLSVAARNAPEIEWHRGEAESLPFRDASFDAVISQFGLMFFADQAAAPREMLRVLVRGGRLAVAVFDSLERNPAYEAMAGVFERAVGNDVASALRFPFSLGDEKRLASLFASAGIPDAAIASHQTTGRFASVSDMVRADVEGWFPFAGISLDRVQVEAVTREAERALRPYLTAGGVEFPISAHIVSTTKG
jgi:ubiquinone/menaquinone biosynthesis C-methylase UbiE